MDEKNKSDTSFTFEGSFELSKVNTYHPRIFIKFDLKLNPVGKFVEAEVFQEFLPLELSQIKELNNRLERGEWLKHDQFYYVEFKPSIF